VSEDQATVLAQLCAKQPELGLSIDHVEEAPETRVFVDRAAVEWFVQARVLTSERRLQLCALHSQPGAGTCWKIKTKTWKCVVV